MNEHLADGTEVFVAEMGTYGRGEIAELCSWIRPDVAVITAIGPVHLERFGSEDRVLEAKAEILDDARLRRARGRRRAPGGAGRDACPIGGPGVAGVGDAIPDADVCVVERRRTCSRCRVRGVEIAHEVPVDGSTRQRGGGDRRGPGARCPRR